MANPTSPTEPPPGEVAYFVPHAERLEVVFDQPGVTATLLAISPSHANFRFATAVSEGEQYPLEIRSTTSEHTARACCQIEYIQKQDDSSLLARGLFLEPIEAALLQRFQQEGAIERRFGPRFPAKGTVRARWDQSRQWFPLELQDVSCGGVCLRYELTTGEASDPFEAGTPAVGVPLFLLLADGDSQEEEIVVEIKWLYVDGGKVAIGCQLRDSDQSSRLLAFQIAGPPSREMPRPLSHWKDDPEEPRDIFCPDAETPSRGLMIVVLNIAFISVLLLLFLAWQYQQ